MKEIDRTELVWVAEGVRGLLLGSNGTDRFPTEFYEEAKRLIGYGRANGSYIDTLDDWK